MSKLLQAGDSSTPPAEYGNLPVYAFYLGGQTPHVWTVEEVRAIPARWGVPIWVNVNPDGDAAADADAFASQLARYGWSRGVSVSLDTEDTVQEHYIPVFDDGVKARGYTLLHYESKEVQGVNPPTSGGKWTALWDDDPDLPAGSAAHQYASADQAGTPWDSSVFSTSIALHELNPIVRPAAQMATLSTGIPMLQYGDRGYAVHVLQGILTAAMGITPEAALRDGELGPVTRSLVVQWQDLYGIPDTPGLVGPATWASLLTRA